MLVDILLLNIIYNYMKEDHRSYRRIFWGCEKPDFVRLSFRKCKSCVYKTILLSRH